MAALEAVGAFGENPDRNDARKIALEARLLEEVREQGRLGHAESSRANGRKTMAGPHAAAIQSAGGSAVIAGPHAHRIQSAGASAGGFAANATHRSKAFFNYFQ